MMTLSQRSHSSHLARLSRTLAVILTLSLLSEAASAQQVEFLFSFGSAGTGNGEFNRPTSLAVGNNGKLYVDDRGNGRVQVFDKMGSHLFNFGSPGTGAGELSAPWVIGLDASDSVLIPDDRRRVQKFDENGVLQSVFPTGGDPRGVSVDQSGDIFVVNNSGKKVEVFDSSGTKKFDFGSQGIGNGLFESPWGMAISDDGLVYVADRGGNHNVQIFNISGEFQSAFGSQGSNDGQFEQPHGVSLDSHGNVFVGDAKNHRVQAFDSSGNFLYNFGSVGQGEGQFNEPQGVAISDDGMIYVADRGNHRVQVFKVPTVVPEPSTLLVSATGFLLLFNFRLPKPQLTVR